MIWLPGMARSMTNTTTATPSSVSSAPPTFAHHPVAEDGADHEVETVVVRRYCSEPFTIGTKP